MLLSINGKPEPGMRTPSHVPLHIRVPHHITVLPSHHSPQYNSVSPPSNQRSHHIRVPQYISSSIRSEVPITSESPLQKDPSIHQHILLHEPPTHFRSPSITSEVPPLHQRSLYHIRVIPSQCPHLPAEPYLRLQQHGRGQEAE